MSTITITHTRAEGTLVQGTSRGDGSAVPLKSAGFRWSRELGCWYLPQSRDKASKSWKIGAATEALKAAGFEVTTEVDDTTAGRSMAEREADRAGRAEARVERFGTYAGNASERAAASYAQARQMSEAIPFGQPMMPDHYSYGRDRRYRDRMQRTYERSFAEMGKADHFGQRAAAAEANQRHRESIPATLRRIEKLEADARRYERDLAGRMDWVDDGNGGSKLAHVKPGERYRARLEAGLADLREQIAYWREHVAQAEAAGVKVWTRADFTKGDFVRCRGHWYEVERVNAKSLSVPDGTNSHLLPVVTRATVQHAMGPSQWVRKITYDDVTGRKSPGEMAALLGEAERLKQEAER